ncbi:zinc metalloprotease HtpX [Pseudokineococcus lusitanus]|uniref:Protease HtpX homolog n=1 Tax=Pseudokineococcus lusitanus TaxID=763993 RepID=A0A3N1HL48_9ACTN|nr:zinc metalloprotease HtpX [Pseudokineococcus lusitanus]ROP43253.1 heat shock protein HtpX [Pseudokineococcus lusitanus]
MGHQHFNGVKTAVLFGAFGGLILFASWLVFGQSLGALTIGLVIALAVNGFSYWKSDSIALRAMRARPVTEAEQPAMHRIVRELSVAAGQPMPRLYVSPTRAPNAFATGRNPQNSAVCCTQGILEILDERELRGVLGHELMHVYNRDILTSSLAAAMASVITFLGYAALIFGGGNRENGGGNPLAGMLLLFLGPLAAGLIQMGISRTREYDADEDGARLTGDPLALASALRKLERGTAAAPLAPERDVVSSSHMMIANPFRARDVKSLFSTHPPMDQRVARLERMAGYGG